jgi:sugar lactone lactonase YvrE
MPEPRTLMDGIAFGESPRWHDGRLWFSDWGAQEIVAVDPAGHSEVVVRVDFPAFPMCIDWLEDRLLIVSGRQGLLLRCEADGSLVTHAELNRLAATPWNDIVVDGRGNAYVNNTGFDFPGGEFAPGFVALVRPDGSVTAVADEVAFPNGMAVTPDNSTLIVAESYAGQLTAFDIAADGDLSNRRAWANLGDAPPDGICIDADGAVWYADVPHRRCVRVAQGGEVLQTVQLDRGCFACMLGGLDGRTLFIVGQEWNGPEAAAGGARTGRVVHVEAPAPGAGWPGPGT